MNYGAGSEEAICIAKQLVAQKYILKISTGRMKKAKWNLTLPLAEARRNDEVISLGDSQMLRWIDELNGTENGEARVREITSAIRRVKRRPNSIVNRRELKRLYGELDALQFKPDYLHLVIDKPRDLHRACKGFRVNGVRFVRLLGTSGGVKNSTIVFVNEKLVDELRRRVNNGRNEDVPQVPAKFEAYRALACSGSTAVSMPRGILVVNDCETKFREDVLFLTDEGNGESEMQLVRDYEIELKESDGYGLMLPSLAARWSAELGLDYVAGGVNTRLAFEKGMVFAFDYVDFAEKVAHQYIVRDAWGNDVDIRGVELVLTTSMLKLWNCYDSLEHYLACCAENHYSFGITKVTPRTLESQRALNYQFIQSYCLTDEQIDGLVAPTMQTIGEIVRDDYRTALLFLAGTHLNDEAVAGMEGGFVKALMVEPKLFEDAYVKKRIYQMIRKRIDDAKIGVVDVHGNYSIISGDPFALCQSMFGLPVTGLLKAGEIYNSYWLDGDARELACFRAPMTCHNNIRKVRLADRDDVRYWFRHMSACTAMNAWDSCCAALNGADKDGDLVMLTDNPVLVGGIREEPAIFCAQRTAEKKEITEESLVLANIASFGDDIGKTTNWITSMFDVIAQFEPGSAEYEALDYRIKCGQLYQQNCIDKTKGIVCKPMPKYWHDYQAAIATGEAMNASISADKKPYFMRYIYPNVMSQYNKYIRNANMKCLREFRMSILELEAMEESQLSIEQAEFLLFYRQRMPVGIHDCVMNRICQRFEAAFDSKLMLNCTPEPFDYSVLKSGAEYTQKQYYAVQRLYDEYQQSIASYRAANRDIRQDKDEAVLYAQSVMKTFETAAYEICNSAEVLCDIVIDVCYHRSGSRQFAWDIVGDQIVRNLLYRSGGRIQYPRESPDGDIEFGGKRFEMACVEVEV